MTRAAFRSFPVPALLAATVLLAVVGIVATVAALAAAAAERDLATLGLGVSVGLAFAVLLGVRRL